MIGTSDENKAIAYLYFYDFELDVISLDNENEVMPRFVRENFNYEFQ